MGDGRVAYVSASSALFFLSFFLSFFRYDSEGGETIWSVSLKNGIVFRLHREVSYHHQHITTEQTWLETFPTQKLLYAGSYSACAGFGFSLCVACGLVWHDGAVEI